MRYLKLYEDIDFSQEEDWEEEDDNISPLDNGEPFSDSEIKEFISKWGQSDKEILVNLGYVGFTQMEEYHIDIIGDDYFWMEDEEKWYPRHSMMFTDREQGISNYLYNNEGY